jgi:hypothetical protein
VGRLENSILSNDHESFDAALGNWAVNANCTIARTTANFYTGPAAMRLTSSAAGGFSAILGSQSALVLPGTTYVVGFRAFSATAGLSCQINVDWYTPAGVLISSATTTSQPIGTSTWTRVFNIIASPATAGEARFSVGNATAAGAGVIVDVDDVEFHIVGPVSGPLPLGPGPSPGWVVPPLPWQIDPPTAVPLFNTFDGGTDGTTITTGNSGGASGDPWSFVQIAAGGTATYVAASAYRGGMSGQFVTGTAGAITYAEKATGNSSAGTLYVRLRFKMPTLPPDATGMRFAVVADSTGAFQIDGRLTNAGTVELRTGAGSLVGTSTSTYTAGQWVDVGLGISAFSATAGALEMKLYDHGGAVIQTIASSATLDTLRSGGANKLQVGAIRSGVNSFAVVLDDVAMSSTGYPVLPILGASLVAQSPNTTATPAGAVATVACAPSSAHNLAALIIHIQSSSTTVTSVTDNLGGTWLQAASLLTSGSSTEVWYRPDIPAGITSVAATMSAGTSYDGLVVEVAGVATASPVRATNTAATTSSPNDTGSVAALAGDFLLGGVSANSATARTQLSPFVALATGVLPASFTGAQGYLIPGADGTYDAQWSTASASNTGGVLAAFKNAAAPAGSVLSIDGAAASTSTAAGDLTATLALAGAAASTSTAVAAITATLALAGAAASTSAATGAVTATLVIAGTAASVSAASGALTRVTPIAGAAASTSTATGAITATLVIAGAAASTSTATGALTRVTPIAGAAASTSAATGDLAITSGPQTFSIAGAAASTSTATGAITATLAIAGAAASTSAATGAVTQRMAIAGAAASSSTAAGSLTQRMAIAGAAASGSAAALAVTLRMAITAAAASTSAASGSLGLRSLIAGDAASTSAAFGDLSVVGPVSPIVVRPNTGTTTRPGTGTTTRPNAGTTTRPGTGTTTRPNAGITARP